jgi:hypothetical protein
MNGSDAANSEARSPIEALPDTYSRRKRLSRGDADPLQCGYVPEKLLIQVLHIVDALLAAFTDHFHSKKTQFYNGVRDQMRTELGVFRLAQGNYSHEEVMAWIVNSADTDAVVDCVECICRQMLYFDRNYSAIRGRAQARIDEINGRFLEAGSGFQFESGRIIEATSKYLHADVVVPALQLLSHSKYDAANSEFLAAHQAFREQDYEQCLVECCKSFESVIKVIGSERHWGLPSDAQAKTLVKAVFENQLVPSLLESEFTGIRTVLESGVNTIRNKSGGHGAGIEKRVVPRHLAAFQLHQTAAAITLLAEAHGV